MGEGKYVMLLVYFCFYRYCGGNTSETDPALSVPYQSTSNKMIIIVREVHPLNLTGYSSRATLNYKCMFQTKKLFVTLAFCKT